jgi:hypothetical protein
MTLYLYQLAENANGASGAVAVIAHSEQNAQEQSVQHVQRKYPGAHYTVDHFRFYAQEPQRQHANKYRFPMVLKERFTIAGFLGPTRCAFRVLKG